MCWSRTLKTWKKPCVAHGLTTFTHQIQAKVKVLTQIALYTIYKLRMMNHLLRVVMRSLKPRQEGSFLGSEEECLVFLLLQ